MFRNSYAVQCSAWQLLCRANRRRRFRRASGDVIDSKQKLLTVPDYGSTYACHRIQAVNCAHQEESRLKNGTTLKVSSKAADAQSRTLHSIINNNNNNTTTNNGSWSFVERLVDCEKLTTVHPTVQRLVRLRSASNNSGTTAQGNKALFGIIAQNNYMPTQHKEDQVFYTRSHSPSHVTITSPPPPIAGYGSGCEWSGSNEGSSQHT
ncbi:hypothetical protein T06_4495 [Trichinella sp. T6]|nr:hypothetical protein T06_4495 [Trichinella sp. T6]